MNTRQMKNLRFNYTIAVMFSLVGLALGLAYSWIGERTKRNEMMELRDAYLEKCKSRHEMLRKAEFDLQPILSRLNLHARDTTQVLSRDSVKSLILESYVALMNYDRIIYEIGRFEENDSVLFIMATK